MNPIDLLFTEPLVGIEPTTTRVQTESYCRTELERRMWKTGLEPATSALATPYSTN